jgi:hypothetical protein
MSEPAYRDHSEMLDAIAIVRKRLRDDWINAGCEKDQVWGCPSCRAIALDTELRLLAEEYEGDRAMPGAPSASRALTA